MHQQSPKESLISLLLQKSLKRGSKLENIHGSIVIFNTESLYRFFTIKEYKEYVYKSDYVCIDGALLSLISKFFGKKLERYHGPDLLQDLHQKGLLKQSTLIGGSSKNKSLIDNKIIGEWHDLPYSDDVDQLVKNIISKIALSKSKIFLVSLGLPKQEIFCKKIIEKIPQIKSSCLLIPAGAALDFMNGSKIRSSSFWQKIGLEWLPRLFREPRMLKRNLVSLLGLIILIKHEMTL